MKAQSTERPPAQIKSRGKTQINYNVKETTIEGVDGKPRTAYEYDMVEIEGEVTRNKVVSAILAVKHPVDAQIAIIFNKLKPKDIATYTAYQAERTNAKIIADEVTVANRPIVKEA